ncbi:carboxymuconolactone decarboxylase family protein [Arthrobacter sp.]|uniref:carboxymuconolactone decarboxylase family protein n=1 Tax=Arthrobacter sp. TaxID=1667 RepID=UPI0028116AD5|nr:carboxymuconolactone decarboxylase family protein [Arthrobacter sp.]
MNHSLPDDTPTKHVFIDKQHPLLWRALNGLGLKVREAAEEAGISRMLVELLYVRISQLNGCAFCLDMHVSSALKQGETTQRLAVLSAWRDTDLFTEQESAALALAESVTELPDAVSREREEESARQHLSDEEFAVVTWLAITMNAFNRVSIISHHPIQDDA